MDVELVAEGASEDDSFNLEHNIDDYTAFDGERCGICMDIVIDRGVLDCCQHWFCFTCIDNWATITNLCPLCQNELQSITCVPVYDTIGSSKVDEDLCIGEDDWCIEGKNNTLSFPSYYIDENAVICLDGDGCKIRSGSVTIEEDSNLDTSIACDSCDIWYHAFCVEFDPEGTCENSWLCPRCIAHENPQKSDLSPALGPSTYSHLENATSECLVEAALSGKVSVSVADAGETAVVISMIDGNQVTEGQSEKAPSPLELDDDVKIGTIISSSTASGSKSETPLTGKTCTQPVLEAQDLDLPLSQDSSFSLTCTSGGQNELKALSSCKETKDPTGSHGIIMSSRRSLDWPSSASEPFESSLDLDLGISVGCSLPADSMKSDLTEDRPSENLPMKSNSEELPAGKIVPDRKDDISGNTPSKRKLMDSSDYVHTATVDEETEDRLDPKASTKKVRVERNGKLTNSKGQTDGSVSDESQKCNSEKENDAYDIMSIVKGTGHRTFKAPANNNHTEKSSIERQNAAALRVKKIMRRAAEDKDSSMLVQKLRKEIRDAVSNRSPEEFGENLFDPKLLAAFRTAVAGSVTEPAKISPTLVVKAKKLMLQKGKVRENLTKKIYGIGGRRKRAWTRDCEIEFWKHRCSKAGKPEKIETLKSVLNVLSKSSDDKQIKQATEGMATNSIFSRLYLADTSVFPRKDDIKPLSDLKSTRPVENKGLDLMEKLSTSSLENHTTKAPQVNNVLSPAGIPADRKGSKSITGTSVKVESAYNKAHPNKRLQQPSAASLSGSDVNSQKETIGKSTDIKKDKRKWALEILARKTAATGSNATQAKEADNAILKGNYPLLAQLPVDMRPALALSHHNKIPISVRQAQLYRLTEHFLRKANLPVIHRTADTELAVADAVNIEKEVADRSNSKLVYVNLMSQELLHRAGNVKYGMAAESDPSSTSTVPTDRPEQVTIDLSDSPMVEEALRNTGLLADSPPNSPFPHMDKIDDENNFPEKIVNKEPDNVFEMDSHPELDIYGDFEYDLEDEDFIGASALRISSIQQEESKMKVVFSTISSDKSNSAPDPEGHEQTANFEAQKTPSCLHDCSTDMSIRSSSVVPDRGLTEDGLQQHAVINEGDGEPSAAECEELYGPDKEPLMKRFPDSTVTKPRQRMADDAVSEKCEDSASKQPVKASDARTGSCVDKLAVASVGHHASAGEHETGCSQTSENGTVKEKPASTETKKESDSSNAVSKKVEAYIKEHIRPLCKSGVITSEQYRWAVGKTTEKVMKYHTKEKNANFLIKEGEKVKKLAEQYVEAAQKMERK